VAEARVGHAHEPGDRQEHCDFNGIAARKRLKQQAEREDQQLATSASATVRPIRPSAEIGIVAEEQHADHLQQ